MKAAPIGHLSCPEQQQSGSRHTFKADQRCQWLTRLLLHSHSWARDGDVGLQLEHLLPLGLIALGVQIATQSQVAQAADLAQVDGGGKQQGVISDDPRDVRVSMAG
jgi:hypothetical protein